MLSASEDILIRFDHASVNKHLRESRRLAEDTSPVSIAQGPRPAQIEEFKTEGPITEMLAAPWRGGAERRKADRAGAPETPGDIVRNGAPAVEGVGPTALLLIIVPCLLLLRSWPIEHTGIQSASRPHLQEALRKTARPRSGLRGPPNGRHICALVVW